jgi:putative addiction module component (TIGR02574 family)
MTIEQLQAEVLKLPTAVRAQFAELLLSSLDENNEVDRAWEDEAERRYQAYLAGEVEGIPWQEAHDRIQRGVRR